MELRSHMASFVVCTFNSQRGSWPTTLSKAWWFLHTVCFFFSFFFGLFQTLVSCNDFRPEEKACCSTNKRAPWSHSRNRPGPWHGLCKLNKHGLDCSAHRQYTVTQEREQMGERRCPTCCWDCRSSLMETLWCHISHVIKDQGSTVSQAFRVLSCSLPQKGA